MTQGFPVLAYPSCDNATPVSLFLVFACNESCAQLTLCLLSSLHQGNENQNIILQYDASNIVPGAVSLGPATIPLPQLRFNILARGGNPQIRTLSLRLRKLCPVWCPPSFVPAKEALGQQMIRLVKTTELEIVFDYNWLHRQHHALFHRLIEQPETLSGFPVDRRYRRLRYEQIDWAKLSECTSHAQESVSPGVEDGDLPPEYAEASGKRTRRVSTSPAPISPPRKRVLLSPYEDALNSPTEKASTAIPSPQRLPPATPSPGFPPLGDISPIPPHLASTKHDAVSPSAKSAIPITAPSNLDHAISQTVSTLLPDVLSSLLPSLLPRLLAQSPTPSSQSSLASEISHAPSPPRLSALGISLTDRVVAKMERETDILYKHTLSHANFLRAAADDKFVDMLEEERLALERAAESRYSEFEQMVEDVVDKVVGRVEDEAGVIEDRVIERLEGRAENVGRDVEELKKQKVLLEKEKEMLRRDVEALRADKDELKRDKSELRHDKEELRREIWSLRTERDRLRRGQVQPEYARTQPSMRDSSTEVESREGSVLA